MDAQEIIFCTYAILNETYWPTLYMLSSSKELPYFEST